ncbi:hypothetical protein [Streptomyces acidiscabies]|uniref:hypothetical protein n=1 Tax=Streptomyces acidiscabies TaxID=42234 RepID=UPI0038F72670
MGNDLLEAAIRPLVREYTGPVAAIQRTVHGDNSDLTAIVDCEKGPFFIKAVRDRPGGRRDSLLRERRIGAALAGISPPLRWSVEADGWLVLGFEAVGGRSADFAPGSPDLPRVVETIERIGRVPLPVFAQDWHETRWDRFASDGSEAELFRGDALLHTDINPHNLLVAGPRMWAVDWAWPTRGAAFIDPALLVVQLIAAGHPPEDAERWASRIPAWHTADRHAVTAFAAATLRMHQAFAARNPDAQWLKAMAEACRLWTAHREAASQRPRQT